MILAYGILATVVVGGIIAIISVWVRKNTQVITLQQAIRDLEVKVAHEKKIAECYRQMAKLTGPELDKLKESLAKGELSPADIALWLSKGHR